jgi:hypothetical protein
MTRAWKELGRYGGVGIELVLAILVLSAIGHWFDMRYGKGRDWGMTIGFFLGIAVGVRNLVRVARQMQKDIERAEAQDPEASRWTVDESWVRGSDANGEKPADKDGDDFRE